MFWGLTPALDFLEKYENHIKNLPKELNILIVGGCDCRHVLKTISRRYRHEAVQLNFYLMDACVENIARQLLLFMIAFKSGEEIGEAQKTKIFMELYGNAIIRPFAAKFLQYNSEELLKMITNYDYLDKILPNVKIDIKYKERDYLENLIKFWCSKDDFDICKSWDLRVRKMLGTRYDSKFGAFDWDLHMRFQQVGGKSVCNQEYRSFRNNGIAFNWLESEVSKPNRTYACVTIPNGEKFIHYGYLGDIQTGPFVAYGLECEDQQFLARTNGHNKYRSTDITERNLRQLFHELVYNSPYEHKHTNDYQLGCVTLAEENLVIDIAANQSVSKNLLKNCIRLNNVSIQFLSLSNLNQMNYKKNYKNFFNIIYFNSAYVKHLDNNFLSNIASDRAVLFIENQLFVLNYREKQLSEYYQIVKEKLQGLKLVEIPFDIKKDFYMEYIIKS